MDYWKGNIEDEYDHQAHNEDKEEHPYVNKELKLTDRKWVCPHCGATHDRDLLAANNILRRGIYELESNCKTKKQYADGQLCYHPRILFL